MHITNSLFSTFIGQQLSGVFSQHDISTATVGTRKGRVIPLNHHVFDKDRGWMAKPSAPQPTILVTAKPCPDDHSQFGHPVTNSASLRPVLSSSVCADTGCQSTAIPPSYAYKAGYRKKDLIPVASKMNGAGRSDLGGVGAVVMKFTCTGAGDEIFTTTQLCYVCDRISSVYLSRQALTDLQCISPQFPTPLTAQQLHFSAAVQREDEVAIPQDGQKAEVAIKPEDDFTSVATCSSPPRPQHPPPLPTAIKPEDDSTSVAVCSCPHTHYTLHTTHYTPQTTKFILHTIHYIPH